MFSRKSSKPIELSAEIDIAAHCSAVYNALNLHSPQNRYLQRGFSLTPVASEPDSAEASRFLMTMPNLPDLKFFMSEQLAVPNKQYDIHCDFPPGKPVGILTGDHSSYRLSPLADGLCRLTCDVAFQTIPLSKKSIQKHSAMLIISLHDDLARLKALIEESAEAAEKAGALDEFFDLIEDVA